jgi:predicted dehydrogenase
MSKNILVVGCGSIGERHLRCLLRTGRAQVTACETNSGLLARMEQEYRVTGFTSLSEALGSQKFDGIVICTPAHTHIGLAITALRSGAGLLIEKPLSVSLEQIDELKQEIAKVGTFVGIAYVYHFMPAVVRTREVLQSGALGRPLQVSIVTGQHFPTYRPAYREIYYTRHETGGGAIQDALTHLANAVEWLVGPTSRIACEAKHQSLEGVTVEDTVSVTARNNDVLVSYSLNQFQAPNEFTIQIHCEHGSLKIELHEQRWAIFPRGAAGWDYHPTPVNHRDDLFVAQAEAFLDGLEGKPNALCTFDEGVQTLKFNLAALQSARIGEVIAIT